jgi:S-adenosylmethionine:tRNA ribosyltransferase-isomerase
MMAATGPDHGSGKLLAVSADGQIQSLDRTDIASLFTPGDLVVANDAATIPGSLHGIHQPTASPIEIRLAAFANADDLTRFIAVAFGAGDHRTLTENRPPPPTLTVGDRLVIGPLVAVVERLVDHPRLVELQFLGGPTRVLAGLAHHGKPIQYAHVPDRLALWDVWTNIAATPFAFEPPSAGFALDWRSLATWQKRGIQFATLTHGAGISSTGDPVLDERLPFDEPYMIPEHTGEAIASTRSRGGSVIAIGTTVARALESAARLDGTVRVGSGVATGRIGPRTPIQVVDTILSGVHEPGESHFELLRAFTSDATLHHIHDVATKRHYRTHEFGDSVLIERRNLREAPPTTEATAPLPLLERDHRDWHRGPKDLAAHQQVGG